MPPGTSSSILDTAASIYMQIYKSLPRYMSDRQSMSFVDRCLQQLVTDLRSPQEVTWVQVTTRRAYMLAATAR